MLTHSQSACFSSSLIEKHENGLVTREDLEHLRRLVEVRDGGPSWQHMMSRSMPNMSYQAWRRDTQVLFWSNHKLYVAIRL